MLQRAYIPILFLLAGCSALSNREVEIVSEQPAQATVSDGTARALKAGESLRAPRGSTVLLEGQGALPMLLVPVAPNAQKVAVHLRPLPPQLAFSTEAWRSVDKLLADIGQVQTLLREGKGEKALSLTDSLVQAFPQLEHLRYLKASCLIVLGQRDAANAILESLTPATDKGTRQPASVKTSEEEGQ